MYGKNAFDKMKNVVHKMFFLMCFVPYLFASNYTFSEEVWQSFTASNKVYDIACDGDYVWCATLGGIFCWDRRDGTYTRYTTVDGLADNHVESLLIASDGTKWFRTLSGVSNFNGTVWRSFTVGNRLPYYYVSVMYEQSNGTMWFGTRQGIAGFEGLSWITDLPDNWIENNDVKCILEDSGGNMWFGTNKGVLKYDGLDWTHYTVENGITNELIRSVYCAKDGSVWIVAYRGLTHFEGENLVQYLPFKDIVGITESRNGDMWFGTSDGVHRFDGEGWKLFEGKVESNLCIDTNDTIWYSSGETIVSIADTLKTIFTKDDGLPEDEFPTLIPGIAGDLWAISDSRTGIAYYDGFEWKTYDDISELRNYTIYDVCVDDEGSGWFGLYGGGLWRFSRGEWNQYITDDGPADSHVEYIMVNSKNEVICSAGPKNYNVFSLFDGATWTKIDTGIRDNIYEMKEDSKGVLWLCMEDGVASIDGSSLTWYTEDYGLGTGNIRTILVDSKGNVWCGHDRGNISKFDGISWEEIYPDGGGVLEKWIYTIDEDKEGNIWVGAYNGLGKFDGNTWTFYLPGDGFPEGANHTAVYDLAQDQDGYIWIGTSYGIGRFDGKTWITYSINNMGESFYYSIEDVCCCAVDNSNNKWFGTYNRGAIKFDGETWTVYNTHNGLSSNTVRSIAVGHNGDMWFGTDNGLSVLRDEQPTNVSSHNPVESDISIESYPNPLNSSTAISFSLPSPDFTELVIYNIMGQKVRTLLSENQTAGSYSVTWDGRDEFGKSVSSGIYLSNLKAGKHIVTGRMTLVK